MAIDIYQDFLDDMAASLLAGDADAFCARIFLPHVIQTENARFLLEDAATSRRHFTGFAQALKSQGINEYVRSARDAWFESAEQTAISGRHESFMMNNGLLVVPRFRNEARLELRGGIWGSTWTRHMTRYASWPDILPRQQP